MKNLFRQIKKFFQLIYYYYEKKIRNGGDKISYDDRIQKYSDKYNQVLKDINPTYISKFNEYVNDRYYVLFDRYLESMSVANLVNLEIGIDYLRKHYNQNINHLNYDLFQKKVHKIFNDANFYPNTIENTNEERERIKNKLITYLKSSNKYPYVREYVFYDFEEEIASLKLQIVNHIATVTRGDVDKIILDIIDGYRRNPFGQNVEICETPSKLRFNSDLKTPKQKDISILSKIKVYIQSVGYVIKNRKRLFGNYTDPFFILSNRKNKIESFKKFGTTVGFRGWLNRTLLLVRYLFDGNFFKNYKNVKSYRKHLSKTNITDGRRNDLAIKMMKSLDLNKRLIKKDS